MAEETQEDSRVMPKHLKFYALGMMFCLLFVYADTNMSSLYIMGTLGGSPIQSAYPFSYFALGNAITIPLAVHLGPRFGIRNMLKICLLGFITTTALTTFMPTYGAFIVVRLLQGCASGPIFLLIPMVLTRLSNAQEKEEYAKNVVVVFSFGAITGATTGAMVAYFLTWHVMCLFDVALISTFGALFVHSLKDYPQETESYPFDYIGFIFYTLSILTIGSFIIMGQELDWFRSQFLVPCFVVGVISVPFFLIRTLEHPYPFLPLYLCKNRFIAIALFLTAFLYAPYYANIALLGNWLHIYAEYSPVWIGIMLAITAFTILFTLIFIHWIGTKNYVHSICAGILFLTVAAFATAHFDVIVDFNRIALPRVLVGIAFPLIVPPLYHLMLAYIPQEECFKSVTLYQIMRTLGSGLGSASYITVYERREAFFHSRMGSYLTVMSTELREFFHHLDFRGLTAQQKNAEMAKALGMRTHALALNDTMYAMGWILIVVFVIAMTFFWINRHAREEDQVNPTLTMK